MSNEVKFVICERSHENGGAIKTVLTGYKNKMFWIVDGDPDYFDPDQILKFDTWECAEVIVNLAWDLNQTYLGIAIWESENPNEIDYTYVNWGKNKNLEVVKNRSMIN